MSKSLLNSLAAASLFLVATSCGQAEVQATAAPSAEQAQPAVPQGPGLKELTGQARPQLHWRDALRCYENEYGWIYASDTKEATTMYETEQDAARLFEKYFGEKPRRGIFFNPTGNEKYPDDFQGKMRQYGAAWLLPFVNPDQVDKSIDEKQIRAQLREAVRKQLGGNLTDEQIDKMVGAQADEAIRQAKAVLSHHGFDAFGHELGHVWFVARFWPDFLFQGATKPSSYGGPAADWLDETAAILLENQRMTANRREGFYRSFAKNRDQFIPLEKLFTMIHPDCKEAMSGDSPVTVKVGVGTENSAGGDSDQFYGQLRALADFMIERSGNEKLFVSIAEAEKAGKGMTGWLKEEGPTNKLPATVAKLEQEFLAWVQSQAQNPPAKPAAGNGPPAAPAPSTATPPATEKPAADDGYQKRQTECPENRPVKVDALVLPYPHISYLHPTKVEAGKLSVPGADHPQVEYVWKTVPWEASHAEFIEKYKALPAREDKGRHEAVFQLATWCEKQKLSPCAEFLLREVLHDLYGQLSHPDYRRAVNWWNTLAAKRSSPFTFDLPMRGQWYVEEDPTCHHRAKHGAAFAWDLMIRRNGQTHKGSGAALEDFYCWNEPLYAVADGVVVREIDNFADLLPGQPGRFDEANQVLLDCGGGIYAFYGHIRKGSAAVKAGQRVKAGDLVARVGNSGASGQPHLHFTLTDGAAFSVRGNWRYEQLTGGGWQLRDGIDLQEKSTIRPAAERRSASLPPP